MFDTASGKNVCDSVFHWLLGMPSTGQSFASISQFGEADFGS